MELQYGTGYVCMYVSNYRPMIRGSLFVRVSLAGLREPLSKLHVSTEGQGKTVMVDQVAMPHTH